MSEQRDADAKIAAIRNAPAAAADDTPPGQSPRWRRAGDFLFLSSTSARESEGIAGAEVDERGVSDTDIRVQTRAAIENLRGALEDAGLELGDLVEVGCFLVTMNDFGGFNEVWAEYFDETGPTRTTVAVHQLSHPLLLVEMRGIAYAPAGAD